MESVLVVCKSSSDIRAAIEQAQRDIPAKGIPVVHIESHGSDPKQSTLKELDFGMNAAPGLLWTELGDWLAPLNRECQFQLLVIGATCFGFGTIAAMKLYEHVAPFAAVVGFTTSVKENSLHDSMKELYRAIEKGAGPSDFVNAAQRELRTGEEIHLTTATKLAVQVLRGVYEGISTPQAMTDRVQKLLQPLQDAGLPVGQYVIDAMPSVLRDRTQVRSHEVWDGWFPAELQQKDPNYRLDWSWIKG
jgi:hypothetical protein